MTEYSQSLNGLFIPKDSGGHWLEAMSQYANNQELLIERINELELALEDREYMRLAGDTEREFSREGLRWICKLAHVMYLKNPLIQRGVNVQRDYVFGQGVMIKAAARQVDAIIQAFVNDAKNQAELTSHQAMQYKEVDLALDGNIFFVFFPNPATGRLRVRSIPMDEIAEILPNPEDRKDPWYYKRVWVESRVDLASGTPVTESKTAYYPDWRYTPAARPASIGGHPVWWGSPVYHLRVGGTSEMQFGLSEVYAALDWAKAYKSFLEDWATIVRAYSRFAWQMTAKGGKAGIAAAKAKLGTTITTSAGETNPPPTTAATFIGSEGVNMQPIRTAGATTSAEDGRRLLLMVAATLGLPESFFGDVSVGTLATAKSLDRPTELKVKSRQTLWSDVFAAILGYVVYWAVKAGALKGTITEDDDGTPTVTLADVDEAGSPISTGVSVTFPPVLEHDVQASVTAIAAADGTGKVDDKTISRLLLQALGVDDVEGALDALYPDGESRLSRPEPPPAAVPPTPEQQAQEALIEAARELRAALVNFREKHAARD